MKPRSVLIAALAVFSILTTRAADPARLSFYIGTYTGDGSEGIYRAELNSKTGTLELKGLAAKTDHPSWLCLHPDGKHLFAAIEQKEGKVEAFSINSDGTLTSINSQSSKGSGNCHVLVDPNGKNVFASNYGSGSLACLPWQSNQLQPATTFIQLLKKEKAPNAHATAVLGQFVYACDLGSDELLVYRLNADSGVLQPNDPPAVQLQKGSGPRHLIFHPNGKFLYVNNESSSGVTVFTVDAQKGQLKELQVVSTLPPNPPADLKNTTAEIGIHPSGKFLYVSNRGHDSIAVFNIGADGKLALVENAPAHGQAPRGFVLDPTANWLIVGGQRTANITSHKIDSATGKLAFTAELKGITNPVSFQFAKP